MACSYSPSLTSTSCLHTMAPSPTSVAWRIWSYINEREKERGKRYYCNSCVIHNRHFSLLCFFFFLSWGCFFNFICVVVVVVSIGNHVCSLNLLSCDDWKGNSISEDQGFFYHLFNRNYHSPSPHLSFLFHNITFKELVSMVSRSTLAEAGLGDHHPLLCTFG